MISLIIFLLIFGILIIAHEFGHFLMAKRQGVEVERFSVGFGPCLIRKTKNGTEYTLCAIPLGGYVKLAGDNLEEYKGNKNEYFAKPPLARAKIIFCGPLLNYVLGVFCFWLIFFCGYPSLSTQVGGLLEGFGAKQAGIQVGDKIISVDGKKLNSWEDLQMAVFSKDPALPVRLSILRQGEEFNLEVKLKTQELDDQVGTKRNVGLLGITPDPTKTIKVKYNFWQSLVLSIERSGNITWMTLQSIWRLISGRLSLRDSITGPIGIFYITVKAAHRGTVAVFNLVGLLSISLAIFNLLPLPVLDGGHLLLLTIEKIRGRYLSIQAERIITRIGFTLIITLAIIVTYNDILRFFGDKVAGFLK